MIELCGDKLKPYVFSDRNYTPYSLRSTYICNLIMQGKDIYDVAKLAGHSIAVCERYYAKLDMGRKLKEPTEIEYGIRGRWKTIMGSYLEDKKKLIYFLALQSSQELSFFQISSDSLINSIAPSFPRVLCTSLISCIYLSLSSPISISRSSSLKEALFLYGA